VLTIYDCVANEHDLRLVFLAAIICTLASFTAITLLHHVRKSAGHMRHAWLAVAAVATGFGIWATHFIAMLAFSPGIPSAYNVSLTVLSLIGAIVITGAGLAVALSGAAPWATWIGGMIVGGGIAVMHYTGMAAFEIAGRLLWNAPLVSASIALGTALGAPAMDIGLRGTTMKWRISGALLLTAAICSHHFTAMGAVTILPDPTIVVPASALPTDWLALAVALASFAIILLCFAGLALDVRDHRRSALEADRMRGLANAAIEGLIVCEQEVIATANNSFTLLAGTREEDVIGDEFATYFPERNLRSKLLAEPNQPVETELRHQDGSTIPVELILRFIDFAGKPHQAIAVRDLRARKRAEQHIRFLAHHDVLTGLPNRSRFNQKLDQDIESAIGAGHRLAVLCLDLDRFKEINDLFGHGTGDMVLQRVSKTVSALLDPSQMMARLGSDEFEIGRAHV